MRLRLLLLALPLTLALAACSKAVPEVDLSSEQPRVTLLQEQKDPSEVRAGVIAGIQNKGWLTESENGPEIVARLNHRGTSIRVSVVYDAQRFSIKGLEADAKSAKLYDRYVGGLEDAIARRLRSSPTVQAPPPPPPPPAGAVPSPTIAVFGREQNPAEIKAALSRALSGHSWVLESDDASGLVARLNHRSACS